MTKTQLKEARSALWPGLPALEQNKKLREHIGVGKRQMEYYLSGAKQLKPVEALAINQAIEIQQLKSQIAKLITET